MLIFYISGSGKFLASAPAPAPTSTPILKNVIFTRILDNLELMYFDFLLNFSLKLTNFKSR